MIERMDNLGIVVEDLEAAIAFFLELGMELEGRALVEGPTVDQLVALEGVRCDIAMVRTPDGHNRLELMRFQSPAAVATSPNAPVNALGLRRILFAVKDIDDVVARLRTHGAELIGDVDLVESNYRMAYLRGPEGIIVALAEQIN
jgi:catechol 2,3-dioxygenase-like lactoylglutathione lyase family enzyme